MNKTSSQKSRKHPTCSRCRFHGKKDVRVLQHQCPFRACTCSSCFLIKRRSIIYRAQKTLDKEDLSTTDDSSGTTSSAFEAPPPLPKEAPPEWEPEENKEFRSLCLTFPEVTRSHLRSVFAECGHDFQRTIDTVLMSTWAEHVPQESQWASGHEQSTGPTNGDNWQSMDANQWTNQSDHQWVGDAHLDPGLHSQGYEGYDWSSDWSTSGQSQSEWTFN